MAIQPLKNEIEPHINIKHEHPKNKDLVLQQ